MKQQLLHFAHGHMELGVVGAQNVLAKLNAGPCWDMVNGPLVINHVGRTTSVFNADPRLDQVPVSRASKGRT
eukprot:5917897-Amphidinium_carterae.1